MRVGLTGGIGSGKSSVATFFAGWGATIVDADVLAHEVVAPGTTALAEIGALWPDVITAQGSLDRAALARVVFADVVARRTLTGIIHPRVRERAVAAEAAAPPSAIVVHVVPLLFEGEFWKTCDRTVVVLAPLAARIGRVQARDNVTVEAIESRMNAQIDPARAAELADYRIVNDGDLADLERRAHDVYAELRSWAKA